MKIYDLEGREEVYKPLRIAGSLKVLVEHMRARSSAYVNIYKERKTGREIGCSCFIE